MAVTLRRHGYFRTAGKNWIQGINVHKLMEKKPSKNPFLGRLFLSTRLFFGSNFFPAVLEYPFLHNVMAFCLWGRGFRGNKFFLKVLPLNRTH